MSDLLNFNFSNITELALAGAAATLLISVIAIGFYLKRIAGNKSSGELSEGTWDGIKELKNPLPLGWAISFLVLCVWAIWYMFLGYPLNAYSQIGEYNEEVNAHSAKFDAQWQGATEATLKDMGQSIFLVQCAQCHGYEADGIGGKAADLTKWGTEAAIIDSVVNGSKGLGYSLGEMSPMLGGLISSEDEVKAAAAYLVKYIAGSEDAAMASEAEANGWAVCASCHGEDGAGLEGAAPNLTNYGKPEFIADVLNRGKQGFIGDMPSFSDGRLSDIQKQAVGAYVRSVRR